MTKVILDVGGISNNNNACSDYDKKDFTQYSVLEGLIKKIRDGDDVIIHGGEPLIHPDFFKILSSVYERFPREVIIVTNARMLSYENFCSRIKDYENLSFIVEVLGNDKIHDSLSRVKGSFKQTIGGIRNLVKSNFKVEVLFPLLKSNWKYIGDLVKMTGDWGVSRLIVYNPVPKGNCLKDYWKNIPKFSDAREEIAKILRKDNFLVQLGNFPYCFLKEYPENFTNILNYNDGLKVKDKKCTGCSYNGDCPGVFRKYAEEYGFSEISPISDVKARIQAALNRVLKKSLIDISIDEMYALLRKIEEKHDFWDAIYELGYPIPLAVLMLDEMMKDNLLEIKGSNIKLNISLKKISGKVIDKSQERLLSNPNLCQLLVSQRSIEERAGFIASVCGSGGRIAILGDDDFMSISLVSKGIFDEIFVFEFDDKIISKIRDLAKKNNLNIRAVKHDLRKKMPEKYYGKFDAFYTDSPYSPAGVLLFVSRGVELLKKRIKCHGFVSFSCEMPVIQEIELEVQDSLTKMGLFIERKNCGGINEIPAYLNKKYKDFSTLRKTLFENKGEINPLDEWFLAALCRKEFMFHLLTTHFTKPWVRGDFNDEIYYKDKPLSYYTDKDFIKRMKARKAYLDF